MIVGLRRLLQGEQVVNRGAGEIIMGVGLIFRKFCSGASKNIYRSPIGLYTKRIFTRLDINRIRTKGFLANFFRDDTLTRGP